VATKKHLQGLYECQIEAYFGTEWKNDN